MATKLASSSGNSSCDASGNSPNAKEEKKRRGDICICPIFTETIVEQSKSR